MNGIHNSEIDPEDMADGDSVNYKLVAALRDPEYLIALMQTSLCSAYRFNPDSPVMGDISPNQYKRVMNDALLEFEKNVYTALEKATQHICSGLNLSDNLKKKV